MKHVLLGAPSQAPAIRRDLRTRSCDADGTNRSVLKSKIMQI